MAWTKVAEKGDIQTGTSKEYEIDGKKIAVDALRAMNVKIDSLTKEQKKYAESW